MKTVSNPPSIKSPFDRNQNLITKWNSSRQLNYRKRGGSPSLLPSPSVWKRAALKWKPESKREQDLGSSVCLVPPLRVTSMSYIRNTWPVESRKRRETCITKKLLLRPGSYQLSRLPALLLSRGMNIPSSLIDAEISRPPIDHRLSYRVRRELILNGITWTMAGWIKIQKIWKFHRQDYPLKVKKLLEFEREREIGRIFILEKHFNRYKLSCVIQSFKSFSNCSISSRRNIFSLIFRINAIKILSGKRKR